MRRLAISVLTALIVLNNCSKTTAPDTGSGAPVPADTLENVYHIRGILIKNQQLYGDSLLISWFATDSAGQFFLFDTLYVDTIAIPHPGFQVFIPHYYFPDKVYRLEFKSDSMRAIIYGRTPPTDSIVITSPMGGDTVQAGDTIDITWVYYPSPYPTDSMHLWFYGPDEELPCHHAIIPAYETSYRFDTAPCSGYSSVIIMPWVMYHNPLETEGAHPSPISGAPAMFLFGIAGNIVEIHIAQ